ncbi:MAG: hypothetical protein JXB25_13300 [Deltaproteobacteria bacterium]|nr:hypothetical protein [Deltaproteobacteria bacterium]
MAEKTDRKVIARVLDQMEIQINELKTRYEQYFGQVEKREPVKERQELERSIRLMAQRRIIQTDLRFRYQTLSSRFYSYCQHWDRIVRRIEEGKFFPDHKTAFSPPPPASPAGGSRGEQGQLDSLYDEFVRVRQSCNLGGAPPDKNQVGSFLNQQREKIAQQLGTADFDLRFTVVEEGGKPRIKFQVKKRP